MSEKVKNKFLVVLILGLLSAIGPFSIDMYLPGFESIAKDLHTTIDKVQLSLTSFFIGIAFGQIIYGPLLDRFGRRIPLIVGLLIYILASGVLAFTHSVENLIFFRLIQAFGSCAGMVAARALVRDYFPPNETAKVFSMLMLVIGLSPLIAPTTGAYLTHYFGWQSVFIILGIITLIILIGVIILLKDKRGSDKSLSLKPRPILQNFWQVATLPQFYIYALSGGLCSAGMYAYLSGSPFVMMDLYGANERQYGWIFAFLAAGLIGSSQINNIALKKYSSVSVARIAIITQSLVGLIMVILTLSHQMNLTFIIILIFLYLSCQGFVFPNASALALNPFSKLAGSASALLGSVQMAIGALASFMTSVLHDNTEFPMVIVMAVCTISGSILLLSAGRKVEIIGME